MHVAHLLRLVQGCRHGLIGRRVDGAGVERVERNRQAPHFQRQGMHHPVHGGLAGGIGTGFGHGTHGRGGGQEQHPPRLRAHHMGQDVPDQVEGAGRIRGEDVGPLLWRDLPQVGADGAGRSADVQDEINASEPVDCGLGQSGDICVAGQVGGNRQGLNAVVGQHARQCVEPVLTACGHNQSRARLSKQPRRRRAQTVACPRNQGHGPVQKWCHPEPIPFYPRIRIARVTPLSVLKGRGLMRPVFAPDFRKFGP